ncbi:MAG: hypothetical protein ACRD4A_00620 [Candidatus Acidiferrales bacterium]
MLPEQLTDLFARLIFFDLRARITSMVRIKRPKARARHGKAMARARALLQQLIDGSEDPYLCYMQRYGLYCANTGLHDEFRHFFRLPGVDPESYIRVDDEFRQTIRDLAGEWLADHSE